MFPNGEHSETFATIGVLTASLGLQTLRQVLLGKKSNDNLARDHTRHERDVLSSMWSL